jgi:hypothetical protein
MEEPEERNLHLLASTASFLENHFASPRGPLLIDTGDNNGYNAVEVEDSPRAWVCKQYRVGILKGCMIGYGG